VRLRQSFRTDLRRDVRQDFHSSENPAGAIDRRVSARAAPKLAPNAPTVSINAVVGREDDQALLALGADGRAVIFRRFVPPNSCLVNEPVLLQARVLDASHGALSLRFVTNSQQRV
jgi:hypothetical protein